MKRGALALSVVLLTAGCTSYDGPAAPSAPGHQRATAGPVAADAAADGAPLARDEPTLLGTPAKLPAAAILHSWDRRRGRAWATGNTSALADLYVAGSPTGRADVALLRSYLRRGLRVVGLRMQLLAVRVLRQRPRRWRLQVTDRLARAVAVSRAERVSLPRDRASTRVITLVRGDDGHWRIVSVEPLPRR